MFLHKKNRVLLQVASLHATDKHSIMIEVARTSASCARIASRARARQSNRQDCLALALQKIDAHTFCKNDWSELYSAIVRCIITGLTQAASILSRNSSAMT